MIAVDFNSIHRDWLVLIQGHVPYVRTDVYRNFLLAPMILGLPDTSETSWVLFDPDATEIYMCSIELIYEGVLYRRVNPFTDDRMEYFFEDDDQFAKDNNVSDMREIFLNMPQKAPEPWFAPAGIQRGTTK